MMTHMYNTCTTYVGPSLTKFSKGSNILSSMASGGLGTSNIKNSTVYLISSKGNGLPETKIARVCWMTRKQKLFVGLIVSAQSHKLPPLRCHSSPGRHRDSRIDGSGVFKAANFKNRSIPNASQVESLITNICKTDTVAELELKLDGFQLYLKRDLTEKSADPPPLSPGPIYADTSPEELGKNGSVPEPALAITESEISPKGIPLLLQKAADEGLVIVDSPKVGFFRRSRTIKGKQTPPACQQNQMVNEGQVICYIEQLGGEIPIEADTTGKVIKILLQDGDPVGYGDPLITILPSFPGIKYLK